MAFQAKLPLYFTEGKLPLQNVFRYQFTVGGHPEYRRLKGGIALFQPDLPAAAI
jgi:hypothetical protein